MTLYIFSIYLLVINDSTTVVQALEAVRTVSSAVSSQGGESFSIIDMIVFASSTGLTGWLLGQIKSIKKVIANISMLSEILPLFDVLKPNRQTPDSEEKKTILDNILESTKAEVEEISGFKEVLSKQVDQLEGQNNLIGTLIETFKSSISENSQSNKHLAEKLEQNSNQINKFADLVVSALINKNEPKS